MFLYEENGYIAEKERWKAMMSKNGYRIFKHSFAFAPDFPYEKWLIKLKKEYENVSKSLVI